MDKLPSLLKPDPNVPLAERQSGLLIFLLCGVYALAAVYLIVAGATLVLQAATGVIPSNMYSWGAGLLALSILLIAVTLGLWRARHWAVTFSALILTASLVYNVLGDIDQANWLMAILKVVVIGPAVAAGHMRLWREASRRNAANRQE
jgi:hypothetical protein